MIENCNSKIDKMQLKLSIVTINKNNSAGLRKTIESVLKQTFTDYEYIIIDGGSSDGSIDIIKENGDKLSYWVSEPDKGIYNAMNKGILRAKGDYLQFLNSGDCLVDETILSKVFDVENLADIIYGDIYEVFADGDKKLRVSLTEDNLTLANFNSNTNATIQHPASFIHKSLFSMGLYDENYKVIADIKFFIERIILQNCTVKYLKFVITNFNMEGYSSNPATWAKTIEERNNIFKELLPPRIYKDYEVLFKFKDSPLLIYIPILEKTTGLNKLVVRVVDYIIKI